MINLINKENYKIVSTNKPSQFSRLQYTIISDELVNEIQSKYYEDGIYLDEFDNEVPNMVDLHLISSILYNEIEGHLFDEVSSIIYKDRDLAIENYNTAKEIDANYNYFKGCKYKVIINDFERFNESNLRSFSTFCMLHPDISIHPWIEVNGSRIFKGKIFLNIIKDEHMLMIENSVYEDDTKVFVLETNLLY